MNVHFSPDAMRFPLQSAGSGKIQAAGKFFWKNGSPIYLRGVTYGTFAPDTAGHQFPSTMRVAADFRAIAEAGFNTIRTYTVPPLSVLDLAAENNLAVMVGLTWEQHVAFLNQAAQARDIRRRVWTQAQNCNHQSVLAVTIGNEIPASIVRWHGRRRIERFLHELFDIAKTACPQKLATYVNYPTTAYLELPFLDFAAFNVYLEEEPKLAAYLKQLHNASGDLPLVMAEIGLDSRRNGGLAQAQSLDWQIRTAFREGCAGAFAFAWTDEWHRGGAPVHDWDFGLTTRSREPKPALTAVSAAMSSSPMDGIDRWPSVSVVVCSYNGAATIRDTLDHLSLLDYPDYEVIVVNDGSTDSVPEIAAQYDVRLISTRNQGLSQARNEGLAAARGEIIAYIDDDAYPTKPWLRHLARAFIESDHTCIGGPNFVPVEDGWVGQCVADSPGGPLPVLLTDELAEHVPGCNMAFRRERLRAIGGFDPQFRAAGDDVDICWRILDKGWTIGFAPAAMVWHHRRATVKRYWRQQVGYGKAESLLERKWPGRFSALGHMSWSGKIYGRGLTRPLIKLAPRIYQGQWGLALYQRLYHPPNDTLLSVAQCPEWLIPIVLLAAVSAFGFAYPPLGWALLPAVLMLAISLVQAIHGAFEAKHLIRARNLSLWERVRSFGLISFLHLLQPIARLSGRIKHGLTPWRLRQRYRFPVLSETKHIWSETWRSADAWLNALESKLLAQGAIVSRGGDYDECDFRISGGMLAVMRVVMGVEDHAHGKQYLRFRRRFDPTGAVVVAAVFCLLFSAGALLSGSLTGVVLALAISLWIVWQVLTDCAVAAGHVNAALHAIQSEQAYVRNDVFRAEKIARQNSHDRIDGRLKMRPRNIEWH